MDYLFISEVKRPQDGKSDADRAWDKLKLKIDKEKRLKLLGVIR